MELENKKCLIIYNPMSGKGINDKTLDKYKKILLENGFEVKLVATKYSSHATEIIENTSNYDIVFSIGGDGTLNEVIKGNYLRSEKLVICPLPSGTCNDVARMLGYGKNSVNNLKMALSGDVNDYDIGMINDNPFVYVVGMGKFMNIPYETSSKSKREKGYLAYIKDGAVELYNALKRYRAEIIIDGEVLDGEYSLIMFSNSNHIAGINNFHKNVCLNDGQLEVLLCKAKSKRELVISFLKYFIGKKSDEIISLKAHDISIKLIDKPDKNWCIDGEKYSYLGSEYKINVGEKMKFLTPQKRTKKLFKS